LWGDGGDYGGGEEVEGLLGDVSGEEAEAIETGRERERWM
jgi:hypothetical protein